MTDKYAILGNPVAHSLSPVLHGYFARTLGQDMSYERLLVPEGKFNEVFDRFVAAGGRGCNITVPCKLDAFARADELSPYARGAGAVNTLKVGADGRVFGDNTDGRGFVLDLKRLGCAVRGQNVLILGAGGAARGVIAPLLEENPARVVITNRNMEKAEAIAAAHPDRVEPVSYEALAGDFFLVVNATSSSLTGMLPPVADKVLDGAAFAYDMMYQKTGLTVFLEHCRKLGIARVHDGTGMLVLQAVLGFELWRGIRPDGEAALAYFKELFAAEA